MTTEERVVNEKTGGMKGRKPQRLELVPVEPLLQIAEVYDFGARKYDDHNWRKGYDWSLSYGAAMRHLLAFWNGQDRDDESGLPHVAHAAFHLLALLYFMEHHRALDDRPTVRDEVAEPAVKQPPVPWRQLPLFTLYGPGQERECFCGDCC